MSDVDYKTVAAVFEATYEEKRSRFIAQIARADDENAAKEFIGAVKKKYFDARHNVFAYIVSDAKTPAGLMKASDDGEPGGTAGMPVLNVLKSRNLNNVVAVVTRYFGGIKLGAAGLTRAYGQAATAAVQAASFVEVKKMRRLTVTIDYSLYNSLAQFVRRENILTEDVGYGEQVTVPLLLPKGADEAKILAACADLSAGTAKIAENGTAVVTVPL